MSPRSRRVAICDLDGVIYLGSDPIPGSADAIGRLRSAGWTVFFCTNNATRTPAQVTAKLARVTGIETPHGDILTSAVAVARLIRPGERVMVIGNEALVGAIVEQGGVVVSDNPEAVVCGLDISAGYATLRDASLAVEKGARFLASNLDASFPTPDGKWPGAGALAGVITATTGVIPQSAGKPHPPMRALIRESMQERGIPADSPVHVIGDRPDTDIALAATEQGWSSTLVLTGVTTDPHSAVPPPDRVASDLASAVDGLLGEKA